MISFRDTYRIQTARLHGYGHASAGWCHVVLCMTRRACFFGAVRGGIVGLSAVGVTAHRFCAEIPDHIDRAVADAYDVMPNLVHGIIGIVDDLDDNYRRDTMHRVPTKTRRFGGSVAGSLSTIIGTYKAAVTRRINRQNSTSGSGESVWQPRFYDRVIRDLKEHEHIRRYIAENPGRWHEDRLHP